jgi:hypothetical protein
VRPHTRVVDGVVRVHASPDSFISSPNNCFSFVSMSWRP